MTQYACSTVESFVPVGGVCQGHSLNDPPADEDFPGLSVDCPACEPILSSSPYWASSPEMVPLTEREEKLFERQEREIELQRVADARADREFLHRQRMEAAAVTPAATPQPAAATKPATRSKARGASA